MLNWHKETFLAVIARVIFMKKKAEIFLKYRWTIYCLYICSYIYVYTFIII